MKIKEKDKQIKLPREQNSTTRQGEGVGQIPLKLTMFRWDIKL